MRSPFPVRIAGAVAASVAVVALAAPAHAEASAWVFVGGGAFGWKQSAIAPTASPAMSIDVGVGTSPDAALIVGGFARLLPLFGHGADLVLSSRVATHGFQAGGLGLAFDAGGYFRTWGTPSQGFAGGLTLGIPLGFQVSLEIMAGTDHAASLGAVAGVDLLRLTVYRRALLRRWPNPAPAWTRSAGIEGFQF